jgi:hypothetical protein
MGPDDVEAIAKSHNRMESLCLSGGKFSAVRLSDAFRELRTFVFRAESDDGAASIDEIRLLLNANSHSLRRLCLGGAIREADSWASALRTVTASHLTHLYLVEAKLWSSTLAYILTLHNLRAVTIHGMLVEAVKISTLFSHDVVKDGNHTVLPRLEAFRFVLLNFEVDVDMWAALVDFIRDRCDLRRLDLGACPWELLLPILPALRGLRVLRTHVDDLPEAKIQGFFRSLPLELSALHLSSSWHHDIMARLFIKANKCFR